jgi:hypothetical protein
MSEDELYYKIYDMLLVLRDTRERFSTYSPKDIKALIANKLKSREPAALNQLYKLESMITDLRFSLMAAKP